MKQRGLRVGVAVHRALCAELFLYRTGAAGLEASILGKTSDSGYY